MGSTNLNWQVQCLKFNGLPNETISLQIRNEFDNEKQESNQANNNYRPLEYFKCIHSTVVS